MSYVFDKTVVAVDSFNIKDLYRWLINMDKEQALTLIQHLINEAENVRTDGNKFDAWRQKCLSVLDRIFGDDSKQAKSLCDVNFRYYGISQLGDNRPQYAAFNNGISKSIEVLRSFIWEIDSFGVPIDSSVEDPQHALKQINMICSGFHSVVRQLRSRYLNRPTFEVEDEYDVQDLLHALLRIQFDDIRPEEWTPSYAGKSTRMDFLLKKEKIVIEVKKTRKGLDSKRLGEELIIDIAHYRNHSDCDYLVCFVYDPEDRIVNAAGIKSDLSSGDSSLNIQVIINPDK